MNEQKAGRAKYESNLFGSLTILKIIIYSLKNSTSTIIKK